MSLTRSRFVGLPTVLTSGYVPMFEQCDNGCSGRVPIPTESTNSFQPRSTTAPGALDVRGPRTRSGLPCPPTQLPASTSKKSPPRRRCSRAAPTAIAAFVGFTEKAPDRRPERPAGPGPAAGHQLVAVRGAVRQLRRGLRAAAVGLRLLRQRRQHRLHLPRPEHRRRPASRRTLALPAADRALGTPLQIESVDPDAEHHRRRSTTEDAGDDADRGPVAVHPRRCSLDGERGRAATRT